MTFASLLRAAVAAAMVFASTTASAALINLDFETPGTGSTIIGLPLITGAGTVTLSGNGTFIMIPTTTGMGLDHVQGLDTDFALLSFSFDVSSISFDYAGHAAGAFLAEALDINGNVIASFFDPDTFCAASACFDGSVDLSAAGIRALRFWDAPGGGVVAVIDNLVLDTAAVPEPASLLLLGTALGLLGVARRKH